MARVRPIVSFSIFVLRRARGDWRLVVLARGRKLVKIRVAAGVLPCVRVVLLGVWRVGWRLAGRISPIVEVDVLRGSRRRHG